MFVPTGCSGVASGERRRRRRRRRLRRRAPRHDPVDIVHHLPERRVQAVPRMRERHLQLVRHPPGVGREHQDAVAHQHRLLDVMRHHQHRLHRQLALHPQIDQVGAQRLRRQHVQRAERLVHQQQIRMHHQRPRQPDALAHAARQFLRIGVLEPAQADHVDRRPRPGLRARRGARRGPPARVRRFPAPSARGTARSSGTPSPRRPSGPTAAPRATSPRRRSASAAPKRSAAASICRTRSGRAARRSRPRAASG